MCATCCRAPNSYEGVPALLLVVLVGFFGPPLLVVAWLYFGSLATHWWGNVETITAQCHVIPEIANDGKFWYHPDEPTAETYSFALAEGLDHLVRYMRSHSENRSYSETLSDHLSLRHFLGN